MVFTCTATLAFSEVSFFDIAECWICYGKKCPPPPVSNNVSAALRTKLYSHQTYKPVKESPANPHPFEKHF